MIAEDSAITANLPSFDTLKKNQTIHCQSVLVLHLCDYFSVPFDKKTPISLSRYVGIAEKEAVDLVGPLFVFSINGYNFFCQ